MSRFVVSFPVRYQDTDVNLNATPAALVGAMQEAAILHSESLGRGIDWLLRRGWAWMIVQTRARVLHSARWRTELQVCTWPSEMGRVLSRREFVITDAQGRELVRATTHWAFMDRRVRRVARVPAEVASAYPIDAERALPLSFGRPAPCDAPSWKNLFPVGHRDIDSNHHVNNLRYLEWMIETLPPEVPARLTLHEINIRFQQETPPGGSVRTEVQELPSAAGRRFALQVINTSGEVAACAEMTWEERP